MFKEDLIKKGLLELPKVEDLPFLRLKRDLGIEGDIGIYFLFDKNKMLKYIGASKNLRNRLEQHRMSKNFLYFKYVKIDFCLNQIEKIYIYKYKDFLNQKAEFWVDEGYHYPSIDSVNLFKLLKATKNEMHKSYFRLSYFLSLKMGDLVNLKKEDFDFDLKVLKTMDKIISIPSQIEMKDIKYLPILIGNRAISKAFLSASLRAGFNSIIYTDKKGHPRYEYHFDSLRKKNGITKNQ